MIDVRDAHNPMCDRYHYKHKSYRCTCLEWKHMLENPPYQEWLDRAEFVMEMERQRPRQRFTRIFRPMSPATDRQVGRLVAAMGITYCTLAPMVVVAGWSMGWFEK